MPGLNLVSLSLSLSTLNLWNIQAWNKNYHVDTKMLMEACMFILKENMMSSVELASVHWTWTKRSLQKGRHMFCNESVMTNPSLGWHDLLVTYCTLTRKNALPPNTFQEQVNISAYLLFQAETLLMSHHKASNNASLSNTQKGRIILQALSQFMHFAICTFVQTLLLRANKSS